MGNTKGLDWLRRLRRVFGKEETPKVIRENRRYVRSYLTLPILLDMGKETVDATTFDISEHGLYVRTVHLPSPGASLKARFVLPNGRRISCVLQVVWVNDYNTPSVVINRPPGFGAVFSEISELDQEAIRTAIQLKII